ncbi:MAG: hypothetical protein HKN15_11635 [Xanthomonadales bacterium]|nr:hypothetical protein [Xanthomonadales bacterium]
MSTRKYITTFMASTLVVFAVVTSFNYYIDPFTYYHPPWTAINLSKNQRYANPGLARNYDYGLAVVGTSHVMEISSSRLSQITGVRSINLPFTAGLIREMAELVRLIVKEEKASTVMLEMNFPSFSLGDVVSDYPDEFPMYLYQPRMEMPLRYLMSFDTLRTSMAALDEPGQVTLDNKDDIGERQYGRDRVVSVWNYLVRTWDRKRLEFWARHQHEIKMPAEIMEARLVPLFEAYPEVDFELFLPPNSILFFLHHASLSANDFDRWLSFRNMLGGLAERFEHVRIHDLQTDFQTMTNLDNYRDLGHYNPQILQRLFETIVAGEALVDAETVSRNSIELRKTVVKFGQGFCRQQDVECSENLRAWLSSQDPAR